MEKELILITNPFQRKTFDVFNIIRRDYKNVFILIVIDRKKTWIDYLQLKLIYPNVEFLFQSGTYDFQGVADSYSNNSFVYVPIEEKTTLAFLNQIDSNTELKKVFKYLLPDIKTFNLARNKLELNKWCLDNQIPSPSFFSKKDIDSKKVKFPVIVKPIFGSGSNGIFFASKFSDLKRIGNNFDKYVIQEKLPNGKHVEACFILADNGKIISSYSHKRIETYPKSGGVSVFSKYLVNDELVKSSETVIKKMNYSGLIMIEFIYDLQEKIYKIIEINPRIWGSIILSEYSGKKFVSQYIDLAMKKKLRSEIIPKTTDIYLRWLFPYGIWNFFTVRKRMTCYVNLTYSNLFSSFFAHLFIYGGKILKRN